MAHVPKGKCQLEYIKNPRKIRKIKNVYTIYIYIYLYIYGERESLSLVRARTVQNKKKSRK